jgi:hypothetical protein
MIRRVLWLAVMTTVTAAVFYISRFWDFRLWPREGLFGVEALRPQGGLLARWLRGTELAPFELLIWVIGVFLLLTLLQRLYDATTGGKGDG